MVDLTKSITNEYLSKIRESLKEFVSHFAIGPGDTHLSLETFAEFSTLHSKFNDAVYHSEQAVDDLIDAKVRGPLIHPTRLYRALVTANQQMFTEENGDRPGMRSVLALITDGKPHPNTTDFSSVVNSLKVIDSSIFLTQQGREYLILTHFRACQMLVPLNINPLFSFGNRQSAVNG